MHHSITIRLPLTPCLLLLVGLLINTAAWSQVTVISQQSLLNKLSENAPLFILDVRTPQEYAAGHVPNAINIPHTSIEQNIQQIKQAVDDGKEVVVYCHSGRRAGIAEDILQQAGITRLLHLEGDMLAWRERKQPLEY